MTQNSHQRDANRLCRHLQQHPRVMVLTGAGISLESGIPTYRDENGAWQGAASMKHQDFIRSEEKRQRYWARSFIGRATVRDARPNAAHYALTKLEQAGHVELLVTQNVDNLHQQAGSQRVVDLHGNLRDVICLGCGVRSLRERMQERLLAMNPHLDGITTEMRPDGDAILHHQDIARVQVPACDRCGGVLMPDVVFFGGMAPKTRVNRCLQALQQADALWVTGSSLRVYSGFRFCRKAQEWGKPVVLLNPGATRADDIAALQLKSLPSLIAAFG